MIHEVRSTLAELGLSKKEIDVYLAMLELGAASVQDIAEKADVNRSTTYVMIEALKKRGLASTFEKGNKIFFSAENPQRLMTMVVEELSGVETKKQKLDSCLPQLLAIFNAIDHKPKVRFFEGEEALHMARQELASAQEPVWEVYAVDESLIQLANIRSEGRIEVTRRVTGRALMAIKPGMTPPFFDRRSFDARVMDYRLYPFSGDVSIRGNTLYILTMKPQAMGIIIESKDITDIFRAMYEAAWSCATPWTPPEGWGI